MNPTPNPALPHHLQLALLLAWRPLDTTAQQQALATLAAKDSDHQANWQALEDHRLWMLAASALNNTTGPQLLGPFWPRLQAKSQRLRLRLLQLAGLQQQLERLFTEHAMTLNVLKGPGLSQRLYGDAALRHSKDLDLLVPPQQLWRAVELLKTVGYALQDTPELTAANRRLIERHYWHITLRHPVHHTVLELHWRLEHTASPSLEARWPLPFAGGTISAAEFLYLLQHGARHQWFRLKWLGDILAITERQPAIWQQAEPLARQLRLIPQMAQTAWLIRQLWPALHLDYAAPAPRSARFLAGQCLRFLQEGNHPDAVHRIPLRIRARLLAYEFLLKRRYSLAERGRALGRRLLFSPQDIENLQLPAGWTWCYPLLRLPLALRRVSKARVHWHVGH